MFTSLLLTRASLIKVKVLRPQSQVQMIRIARTSQWSLCAPHVSSIR